MFVRLLGTVGAGIDDQHVVAAPGRVAGAVLCHLALAGGRAVPTGGLIDLVWPTATPTARNAIQVAISRLRKLYGADLIDSDAGGYRLPASLLRVDLADAEQLARISRDALEAGRPIEALDAAERAAALFVGDPLTGVDPSSATATIARAEQLQVEIAVCVARALLTLGRADEAARRLQASVVRQQLDEPSNAVLMRSLAEAGRPAEALRLYADCAGGSPTSSASIRRRRSRRCSGRSCRPTCRQPTARSCDRSRPSGCRCRAGRCSVARRSSGSLSDGSPAASGW